MKSIKLAVAACALSVTAFAQPYTGQSLYTHNATPSILSSGTYVKTNPGFIMAGYLPSNSVGAANFFVDKVDIDGNFTSTGNFSKLYRVFTSLSDSCLSTHYGQEVSCYGASIVEDPNATSGVPYLYALTAAFKHGVIFATLDNTGVVVNSNYYLFPTNATPNSKPLITPAAGGDYYVCGSYKISSVEYVYVLKISSLASTLWSNVYHLNIMAFNPRGIVEDNYPGYNELAIAGTFGSSTTDGFFMTLNGGTGVPIIQRALASGQSVNETIGCLALANSNGGYIVGGSTNATGGGPGHAYMTNLKNNGTPNWSTKINPTTNKSAGEIVGIAERYSSTYSAYEYYGITTSTGANGGMMILKLDQLGHAFSKPGNTNNEFVFNDGINKATSAAISVLDAGSSGNNTGIHGFGNNKTGTSRFFLNQACFNGATGSCASTSRQNLTVVDSTENGPVTQYTFSCITITGLNDCNRYAITDSSLTYTAIQPCSMSTMPSSPYTGSNNRPANPTGVAENNADNTVISVFPNPVNGVAEIRYTNSKSGEVKVTLCDLMGRTIKTLDSGVKNSGTNTLSVDMNSLNLETGVYLINVSTSEGSIQRKIIFNKN